MMILVTAGVMNLWAMAVVAMRITLERLAPWPAHAARASGVVMVAIGAVVTAEALM